MVKIYVNVIENDQKRIISACDMDLIGKTFEEGEKILDVKESFFKGDVREIEELKDIMKDCLFHAVGKNVISFLLKNDVISQNDIIHVSDVPHVIILFE